jgi:hypothetical protein
MLTTVSREAHNDDKGKAWLGGQAADKDGNGTTYWGPPRALVFEKPDPNQLSNIR